MAPPASRQSVTVEVLRTESLFVLFHNSSQEYVTDLHVAERSHLCFVKPGGDVDYTAFFFFYFSRSAPAAGAARNVPIRAVGLLTVAL